MARRTNWSHRNRMNRMYRNGSVKHDDLGRVWNPKAVTREQAAVFQARREARKLDMVIGQEVEQPTIKAFANLNPVDPNDQLPGVDCSSPPWA